MAAMHLCAPPVQAKESWDLSSEEKVALAGHRKERGNTLFRGGKWARAIKKYKSAAECVGYDVSAPHTSGSQPTRMRCIVHATSRHACIDGE